MTRNCTVIVILQQEEVLAKEVQYLWAVVFSKNLKNLNDIFGTEITMLVQLIVHAKFLGVIAYTENSFF